MLTRRRFLATGVAAATVPLALRKAAAASAQVVVMAKQLDDIITFDPAQAYEFSDLEINANIYRKLVSPNLEKLTEIAPDLAAAWEVSSDGKTFTFHLTKDSVFSSGNPVTAEDAAFSLQRVVTLNLTPGFIITQFGFTKDNVAQLIRATDSHTLVLELPNPAATSFVLYCLSAGVGAIVDKKTVMANQEKDDLGNHWLATHSAGSGPYQLTDWSANERVILDANPHVAVAPATKRIFIRHVKDPATQLLMLNRGDADLARDLTPDLLKTASGNAELYRVTSPSTQQVYLAGNEGYEPFRNADVRQAIKWAIDYEGIQKNIVPDLYIVNQSFEPNMILGAVKETPFHKDTDKAKALMKKAGYADGFTATLDLFSDHPYTDIGTALQSDLGEIGIKVELLPGERKQVWTKMRARQHQLILSEWFPDYFDPNSNAQGFCANPDDSDNSTLKIIAWRNHFQNKELTAEVDEAAKELDTEKRVALYQKMQQQFWEDSPIAFMLQRNDIVVVRKDVTGFELGPQPDFTRYGKMKRT
ncbi:MAG: ABC transporter substrate-binding protein [Pseudomonadota bacterium]